MPPRRHGGPLTWLSGSLACANSSGLSTLRTRPDQTYRRWSGRQTREIGNKPALPFPGNLLFATTYSKKMIRHRHNLSMGIAALLKTFRFKLYIILVVSNYTCLILIKFIEQITSTLSNCFH
jgi:hypothetical protein